MRIEVLDKLRRARHCLANLSVQQAFAARKRDAIAA
jgi:hypothetical protein